MAAENTASVRSESLIHDLLDALVALSGPQPGFRPAHAKGVFCKGEFTPAPTAKDLTRAPHANRASTPVVVRFSDSTGVPVIPDNDEKASPRGMAVRFHLADHVHTDVVAHSHDGFPVRTGADFLTMLRAVKTAFGGDPTQIGLFLDANPSAKRFVTAPKPTAASFATESHFAVTAFKFVNAAGEERYGRFRIRPAAGEKHLTTEEAAAKAPNFLFDELKDRLARGPVEFEVRVLLAEPGDVVDDATAVWPASRKEAPFGTLKLTSLADQNDPEMKKLIFDPVPRVDGIESAGDPLTEVRSEIYLMSGRKRRQEGTK